MPFSPLIFRTVCIHKSYSWLLQTCSVNFLTRTFGVYGVTWWKTLNIVCLSSRLPCLHEESRTNVCWYNLTSEFKTHLGAQHVRFPSGATSAGAGELNINQGKQPWLLLVGGSRHISMRGHGEGAKTCGGAEQDAPSLTL